MTTLPHMPAKDPAARQLDEHTFSSFSSTCNTQIAPAMSSNSHITRSIRKFGRDLKSARLRRRLPMALVAERAGISLKTLSNLENGSSGVSLGNVAAVLYALGFGTVFSDILDQKNDNFGLLLDEDRLPKRARLPRQEKTS